ncbi:MAG: HAMP domain-containing protein [Dehalococcoidia bacterium]|nr:MAG: HAMP domain-containing protein [Dehalococcoidia bacterium]
MPRSTVRLRLTLLYGTLFLVSGALLLGVTYTLVDHVTSGASIVKFANGFAVVGGDSGDQPAGQASRSQAVINTVGAPPAEAALTPDQVRALAAEQHAAAMRRLLAESGIALAIMTVASMGLGWIVAGRVLRPLRTITSAAREISANNLHERLALGGPEDELKELGDTIDGLLGRLEGAFSAQRQFVANASHELRSPLARQRTLMQVALSDPAPTIDSLRVTLERTLAAGAEEERLIEALLSLTRGQSGLQRSDSFDLASVTEEVLLAREQEARERGLELHYRLLPAPAHGDRRLAERLVANLTDNAVRYNVPGGTVEVATHTEAGRSVVSVTNTGPIVLETEVDRILRPFQRLGSVRTNRGDGLGLGLSIVQAIAHAHGAVLRVQPHERGGLRVEVRFPAIG